MYKSLFYNKFIIFPYMFRAQQCSKHVEEYNKLVIKQEICALSWSITTITQKVSLAHIMRNVLYNLVPSMAPVPTAQHPCD